MERQDLEKLVRRLVSEVVDRVESAPATAPRREEAGPVAVPATAPAASPSTGATTALPAAAPAAQGPSPLSKALRVAIGSDHGGFELKEILVSHLHSLGYPVMDVGTHGKEAVDYPDFARVVAQRVARGEADRGVVIDGAGIGSGMVANKVRGVRAAVCHDLKTVENSRDHNDANVLCLGSGVVEPELARQMVARWLEMAFSGGRHTRRVAKINELDSGR